MAKTLPVFAGGDKSNLDIYRPISILPYIQPTFTNPFPIPDYSVLLVLQDHCGSYAGLILCNLSKPFDMVSHKIMVNKLSNYNFDQSSIKLIESYLNNRKQYTALNGNFPPQVIVKSRVIRGAVLGLKVLN